VLQTLFKNINKYVAYVPCTALSLHLDREKAASAVPEIVDCGGILRQLYVL
jgi:hypothetical protein